jgi:hypothetical protein
VGDPGERPGKPVRIQKRLLVGCHGGGQDAPGFVGTCAGNDTRLLSGLAGPS